MAKKSHRKDDRKPMFFSSYNYKIIGVAIFLIIGGFTAMYLENEVEGIISLYISPIVIVIGYVLVLFAILKHNRPNNDELSQTA